MENKDTLHKMMQHRRVELNNPLFNTKVMQAIEQEQYAKVQRQRLFTWLLIILTIYAGAGLLLWNMHVTLSDMARFPFRLPELLTHLLNLVSDVHYLVIPLVLLWALKSFIQPRVSYTK